eukprot:11621603-Heterocapsa_arctica.AAC.1
MELVVWLERSIKTPESTKLTAIKKEEEKPANTRTFYRAINMLKGMGESQTVEHTGEAKKTRIIVRDLQNELIKRKEISPLTKAEPGVTEGKMGDMKEAKKHRKSEEEE